jgi:transposase-like protein
MVASLRRFSENEVAQQRLKIIKFYEKHGEEATREAFGVDRKLISKWRKRVKENRGRLEALIPYSTRPKKARKANILQKIIDFIPRSSAYRWIWVYKRLKTEVSEPRLPSNDNAHFTPRLFKSSSAMFSSPYRRDQSRLQ